MDFTNLLQVLLHLDPLYFVAGAGALIAFGIFCLALSLPRKIGKLVNEVGEAADNITFADAARKREATLASVRRFESDPEIRDAVRYIWQKTNTKNGTDYSLLTAEDRFQVVSYLNYLDGVAVGLKQGVLDESVAKDYLQHVVHKSVLGLLLGESGESWHAGKPLVDAQYFENLILLQKQWGMEEVHPLFRMIGHGVTGDNS